MHNWTTYPLPAGTVTALGTIERISSTAYLVDGKWLAHQAIHGKRAWVEPLVILR